MHKNTVICLMQVTFFLFATMTSFLFAETLTLKSGQKVEGEILERGAESTKVEVEGVVLTFWNSQIEGGVPDEGPVVTREAEVPSDIEKNTSELRRYYTDKQYEKAQAAAKNLIGIDPDNADFHFFLAVVNAKLGQHTEAAASLEKALSLKKDDPGWYAALGIIYDSLGMKNKAGEMLLKARDGYTSDSELLTDLLVASFFVESYMEKVEK